MDVAKCCRIERGPGPQPSLDFSISEATFLLLEFQFLTGEQCAAVKTEAQCEEWVTGEAKEGDVFFQEISQ